MQVVKEHDRSLKNRAFRPYRAAMRDRQSFNRMPADALEAWVQGCEAIPPDGNFGGDMDACASCLSVLVEEVYNE